MSEQLILPAKDVVRLEANKLLIQTGFRKDEKARLILKEWPDIPEHDFRRLQIQGEVAFIVGLTAGDDPTDAFSNAMAQIIKSIRQKRRYRPCLKS